MLISSNVRKRISSGYKVVWYFPFLCLPIILLLFTFISVFPFFFLVDKILDLPYLKLSITISFPRDKIDIFFKNQNTLEELVERTSRDLTSDCQNVLCEAWSFSEAALRLRTGSHRSSPAFCKSWLLTDTKFLTLFSRHHITLITLLT